MRRGRATAWSPAPRPPSVLLLLLRERLLELAGRVLVGLLDGLLLGLGELALDLPDPDLLEDGDDARGARRHDLVDVFGDALLVVVLDQLAGETADQPADDHGSEQRRREQADDEAAGHADHRALEHVVVAGLLDV